MECDRCHAIIAQGEDRELHGRAFCEDCYIDAMSPAKACDPWAVYSAASFSRRHGSDVAITETQSKILQLLEETGGAEPAVLSARLGIQPSDLEREVATLRHMEKLRAELRDGRKVLCAW